MNISELIQLEGEWLSPICTRTTNGCAVISPAHAESAEWSDIQPEVVVFLESGIRVRVYQSGLEWRGKLPRRAVREKQWETGAASGKWFLDTTVSISEETFRELGRNIGGTHSSIAGWGPGDSGNRDCH